MSANKWQFSSMMREYARRSRGPGLSCSFSTQTRAAASLDSTTASPFSVGTMSPGSVWDNMQQGRSRSQISAAFTADLQQSSRKRKRAIRRALLAIGAIISLVLVRSCGSIAHRHLLASSAHSKNGKDSTSRSRNSNACSTTKTGGKRSDSKHGLKPEISALSFDRFTRLPAANGFYRRMDSEIRTRALPTNFHAMHGAKRRAARVRALRSPHPTSSLTPGVNTLSQLQNRKRAVSVAETAAKAAAPSFIDGDTGAPTSQPPPPQSPVAAVPTADASTSRAALLPLAFPPARQPVSATPQSVTEQPVAPAASVVAASAPAEYGTAPMITTAAKAFPTPIEGMIPPAAIPLASGVPWQTGAKLVSPPSTEAAPLKGGEFPLPTAAGNPSLSGGTPIQVHPVTALPLSATGSVPVVIPAEAPGNDAGAGVPAVVPVSVQRAPGLALANASGEVPLLSAAGGSVVAGGGAGSTVIGPAATQYVSPQQWPQEEAPVDKWQTPVPAPLISRVLQQAVQPHGAQQMQAAPLQAEGMRKATAEKAGVKGFSVPLAYDSGNLVKMAAAGGTTKAAKDSGRVCFDACNCWPVWASSIAAFVLYSAAALAAVVLSAALFSKGLWSSSFYKGGGYWLLGATAAGATTGALIGALVAGCVGGALGLAAGMMCLFASLVLVGRRGAWLGALGGVLTGGVIGAMVKEGVIPIALGAGIGVLLGVIAGFVPLARHLRMNERYIRRGIAQGTTAASASPARMTTKRTPSRILKSRAATEQFGPLGDGGPSSNEDIRTLATQRLGSSPVGRMRDSWRWAPSGAFPTSRRRSSGWASGASTVLPTGSVRDVDRSNTVYLHGPTYASRSSNSSPGEIVSSGAEKAAEAGLTIPESIQHR